MNTTYRIEINEGGAFRVVHQIDGDNARGGDMRAHVAAELRHWRRYMARPGYRHHGRPRVRLVTAVHVGTGTEYGVSFTDTERCGACNGTGYVGMGINVDYCDRCGALGIVAKGGAQ